MGKSLKKIELHVHLDGSLSLELASKLSGLTIPEVEEKMVASKKCMNLSSYLEKFSFPVSLLQTKENLILAVIDLINQLANDNVIYAEIRFAPSLHTKNGLTQEDAVKAVLEGIKRNQKVKTNLLLCMMRGASFHDNWETIFLGEKYLNQGVVGLDLAGDESKFKLDNYQKEFTYLRKRKIPFTIHAGETDEYDISIAIKYGAKRIGHGIKCMNDLKLMQEIKNKNILLEVCPTSNIQTNAVSSLFKHPISKLYKMGINVLINTDNRTVSNINLTREYMKLRRILTFSNKDFILINENAINYCFISNKEKVELLEEIKK